MFRHWNNRLGHYGLLLAAGACMFFINLGSATLWDVDEGRNATAAYEMMQADNWVVPTFNGALRVDKPALLYWLQIFAYQTFGVNEFAARLPSALAALLTLLLTYELGRMLFDKATGLLAGLVVSTCVLLNAAARFANPDALLNLCTVLTMLLFWRRFSRTGSYAFIGCAAAMGLGVLAKGPVGVVLPLAIICLFLFWVGRLRVMFHPMLLLSVLAFSLVALPWYILVGSETEGEFLYGFLGKHNVNRFLSPMEHHAGGPWYYLLILLVGFFPWSIFIVATLWTGVCSVCRRHLPAWTPAADSETAPQFGHACAPEDRYRFLWCWIGMYLLFFTMAATKLPNYVLPLSTPMALLTARFLVRWARGVYSPPAWLMHTGFASLGLIGVGTFIGLLWAGGMLFVAQEKAHVIDGLASWATIGLVLAGGALAAWWCWRRQRRRTAIVCIQISAFVFLGVLTAGVAVFFNNFKASQPLVEQSNCRQPFRDIRVGCFDVSHLPSLNFYCQRHIDHFYDDRRALNYLRYGLPVYLFMKEDTWQKIRHRAAVPCRIIAVHEDMYRSGRVVVVTNH